MKKEKQQKRTSTVLPILPYPVSAGTPTMYWSLVLIESFFFQDPTWIVFCFCTQCATFSADVRAPLGILAPPTRRVKNNLVFRPSGFIINKSGVLYFNDTNIQCYPLPCEADGDPSEHFFVSSVVLRRLPLPHFLKTGLFSRCDSIPLCTQDVRTYQHTGKSYTEPACSFRLWCTGNCSLRSFCKKKVGLGEARPR